MKDVQAPVALLVLALLPPASCADAPPDRDAPDLVVTDARVLDVETGTVAGDRTVVVSDGRIEAVLPPDGEPQEDRRGAPGGTRAAAEGGRRAPDGARTLDAGGGLVTPGLVDVHGHLAYVLGDSVSTGGGFIAHLDPSPDSLAAYRRRYARAYLPHGVTTVRDAGSAEEDLALLSGWWQEPAPDLPDFFPAGAALVSPEEGRTTFPGHVAVRDPEAARAEVRSYHDRGFRHVKLYWRLREPEFRAALDEARRLGMTVTGHVDFHVLGFRRALELGLRSFEHAYTVGVGTMTDAEYRALWRRHVPAAYGSRRPGLFHLAMTEVFNQLGPDDPEALALAPDWLEPGRVALSEMALLHRAGIPMADVFRIATLNGARALGLEDRGTVEPGMKADLVIWREDPLEEPAGLFGEKAVVRGGRVVDSGG